jgi:beta-RFAP synthase
MITIRTGSRIHFGLLSLVPEGSAWPNRSGAAVLPARSFGGVGLMVDQPGLEMTLAPADSWSAEGPLAERALELAQRFAALVPSGGPCSITIHQAAPEHVGLGTGTQLALAIGQGLARLGGLELDLPELARLTGRGLRSALGAHGFLQGGFLVETGKGPGESLAPLAVRLDFPEQWRILLLLPTGQQGLHGSHERQAFARLACSPAANERTDALCRLVLLGMIPTLKALDADAFGEALFDFNQRAGEPFAMVQGGIYAFDWTARLVDWLRAEGVRGVGQSSWGPTVFAVVADPDRARWLASRLEGPGPINEVFVFNCRARNRGADSADRRIGT